MNVDLLLAIIFYLFLLTFYFFNKEKFEVKGRILFIYRTQLGIKLMDKIAKKFKFVLKPLSYVSTVVGFLGMAFIFYILIKGTFSLIFVPDAQPALAPVLPGVKIDGLPTLGFWHWIISIFIVAVIHEFSHGVFARLFNLKVKNSGFLFFGPILGAFVEPDEKKLEKVEKRKQLAIMSAGPFSNILLAGFVFLLISFVSMPLQERILDFNGIEVNKLIPEYPAEKANIPVPFELISINGEKIKDVNHFVSITDQIKPNQGITFGTDKGEFSLTTVENPENSSKGYIGITDFNIKTKIKSGINENFGNVILWILKLMFWVFIVNLGVGLFNLLPLGPIDGGRMFLVLSFIIFKEKEKAKKFWSSVSYFLLIVIFINLLPYLIKLLSFLIKPFLLLG
ncbi:site-2 protease family protein [Candidatus Woesearchaeota archaeon]|nr:site-2 protease family protein [Candidatus Woesearchaeota archaeon]